MMINDAAPKSTGTGFSNYRGDLVQNTKVTAKAHELVLRVPRSLALAKKPIINLLPSLTPETLADVRNCLSDGNSITLSDLTEALLPTGIEKAQRGVHFGTPTDAFLARLSEKTPRDHRYRRALTLMMDKRYLLLLSKAPQSQAQSQARSQQQKVASAYDVAKACYTTLAWLTLFPGVLSVDDLLATQRFNTQGGALNLAKSYSPYIPAVADTESQRLLELCILEEGADNISRNLFGEHQHVRQLGAHSGYLSAVEPGHPLAFYVREGNRPSPIPAFRAPGEVSRPGEITLAANRPILIITQGGSVKGLLPLVDDLAARKAQGEAVGPVVVLDAVKTADDLLDKARLQALVEAGNIDRLYICMSRTAPQPAETALNGKQLSLHGTRVQHFLQKALFSEAGICGLSYRQEAPPFVYVAGGDDFVAGNQRFDDDTNTSVVSCASRVFGFSPNKQSKGDPGNLVYTQSAPYKSLFDGYDYEPIR